MQSVAKLTASSRHDGVAASTCARIEVALHGRNVFRATGLLEPEIVGISFYIFFAILLLNTYCKAMILLMGKHFYVFPNHEG